jgi:hypothetical protein
LKVIAGRNAGQVIIVPATGVIIGRNLPAEVLLDEPAVSRQHCSIYVQREEWMVEDLGSQNGTRVNGVPISKQILRPGDRIQVGKTVLRVPRSLLMPAIAGVVVAAVLLIVIVVWHAAAGPSGPSATKPASATEAKPASEITGAVGGSSQNLDSDLSDADLAHPGLKRPSGH